eukprot:s1782_g25.t1
MWGSSMLLWKAGKQSVVAASTAESELVEILEGSELPADLGTKVLSFEKFSFFKRLMGMFMGSEGKEERKDEKKKGGKESTVLPNAEAAKQALKAIILFARLAKAKGENGEIQLWQPSFPIIPFNDPMSGLPFFIIISAIFIIGVLLGAVLMWLAVYPYFHRVTLVESMANVIPRPSFLLHSLPEDRSPRPQNGTSHDPLLRRDTSTSTSNAAGVGASSSADGKAAGFCSTGVAGVAVAASLSADGERCWCGSFFERCWRGCGFSHCWCGGSGPFSWNWISWHSSCD